MASRRIWITGASQGIGFAAAHRFAQEGASLALCARRPRQLKDAGERLRKAGAPEVMVMAGDVAESDVCQRFASQALEALGGCDLLIHNAGGGGPCTILSSEEDAFNRDWSYAWQLNVMALLRLVRAASASLREAKGTVITVSSAWRLRPSRAMPPSYGATKAALDDVTASLARELGPAGVRVVGIAPGPVWTETWEMDLKRVAESSGQPLETVRAQVLAEAGGETIVGRPGQMSEIADAIAWLSSPGASFVTGTTLVVDGGFVAGP